MSRIYGEVRQLGYVVRDIDKAMRHWVEVLGIGPWFYVERLPVTNFRYRGEPSDVHASIAIANSGRPQIELIQQRNDAPSMYRDFIRAGHEGLQHVSTWPRPEEYQAVLAAAARAGHRIGQSGESRPRPLRLLRDGQPWHARPSGYRHGDRRVDTDPGDASSRRSRRRPGAGTATTRSAPGGRTEGRHHRGQTQARDGSHPDPTPIQPWLASRRLGHHRRRRSRRTTHARRPATGRRC